MQVEQLKPDLLIQGDLLSEPIKLIKFSQLGNSIKITGTGIHSGKTHNLYLSPEQLQALEVSPETMPYDGDALRFRLGIEALRLSLAYEYDPFFTLSISKIDPLPHQLEAVYDYFLKLPRVRFLLADDPGAGKTIMAGLLIKELKIRGLIKRTLIISPANLTFQWQREMHEKFRENFTVMNGERLRTVYGTNPWLKTSGNFQVHLYAVWLSLINNDPSKSIIFRRDDRLRFFSLT
jgi:SNF2 family DNA or RNA helicase